MMTLSREVTTPLPFEASLLGSRIPLDSSAKENISLERSGLGFLLILVISTVTFSSPGVQLRKPAKTAFILPFTSLKDNFKARIGSLRPDYRPSRRQAEMLLTFISA